MTKKTALIILILTIIILSLIVFGIIFFENRGSNNGSDNNIQINNRGGGGGQGSFDELVDVNNDNRGDDSNDETPVRGDLPLLRQITRKPIVGYTIYDKEIELERNVFESVEGNDEDSKIISFYRYVDAVTGNVNESREDELRETRLTNTTIPMIGEVDFMNSGNTIFIKYFKDDENKVENFLGNIVMESSTTTEVQDLGSILGDFVDSNIKDVSVSDDSQRFFFINKGVGYISNYNDIENATKVVDLYTDNFTSIWNGNNILVYSKPTYFNNGYVYLIENGQLQKIIGGLKGLSANINKNNNRLITSNYSKANIETKIIDLDEDKTLGLVGKFLAEKCVWSNLNPETILYCASQVEYPSAQYPDDWYKGKLSFKDYLFRVDLENQKFTKIEEVPNDFDIIDLQITNDDQHILFINKKDYTLWSIDVSKYQNTESSLE